MDSLAQLQRRKAELKAQIEQQRADLKKTLLEVRQEIEPANLLKKAVSGMFKFSQDKKKEDLPGVFDRLPAPARVIIDLLIKDSRWALLLKLLAPVAMNYLPSLVKNKTAETDAPEQPKTPVKVKIYGSLRKSVTGLRNSLRKKPKAEPAEPEPTLEPTEN